MMSARLVLATLVLVIALLPLCIALGWHTTKRSMAEQINPILPQTHPRPLSRLAPVRVKNA